MPTSPDLPTSSKARTPDTHGPLTDAYAALTSESDLDCRGLSPFADPVITLRHLRWPWTGSS